MHVGRQIRIPSGNRVKRSPFFGWAPVIAFCHFPCPPPPSAVTNPGKRLAIKNWQSQIFRVWPIPDRDSGSANTPLVSFPVGEMECRKEVYGIVPPPPPYFGPTTKGQTKDDERRLGALNAPICCTRQLSFLPRVRERERASAPGDVLWLTHCQRWIGSGH